MKADLESARQWIDSANQVTALTGAGISTDSGIPDFRGPNGLWMRNPSAEKMSHISHYISDREVRKAAWRARLHHPAWSAKPNLGHAALADLENRGKLRAVVTQNIDGLHQVAGNSPERVIEVHGTVHQVVCLNCAWKGPMQETLARVRAGEDDPSCTQCGGMLKSDTISFGQPLIPEVLERAALAVHESEILLAVGSTLQVYPVAALVPAAKSAGARVIIVNSQETPFDGIADAVFHDPISEVLPKICC
jgi:NAD-dependent deacetylase